jgi:20S proteasome subunit alpha 4
VTALLEVVESGSKNLEVAIVRRGGELQFLEESVIDALVLQIEADKEAAAIAAAAAGPAPSIQSAGNM